MIPGRGWGRDPLAVYPRVVTAKGTSRSGLIEAAGHLALWAGWYALGCALYLAWLMGLSVSPRTLTTVFLVTVGTYLLDRVGPWPAPPDRADVASVPGRVRFLRRAVPQVRIVAALVLVLGCALAVTDGPLVALVVPAAVVGMLCYSHAPDTRRLKDVIVVKNLTVSVSITALVVVLVCAASSGWSWDRLSVASAALLLNVMAGAMLCDLDDRHADARRGTRTIPNTLGPSASWWIADALVAAAAGIVLIGAHAGMLDATHATALALLPLGIALLLHLARPRRVRNLVDIAFPAAVVCAGLV